MLPLISSMIKMIALVLYVFIPTLATISFLWLPKKLIRWTVLAYLILGTLVSINFYIPFYSFDYNGGNHVLVFESTFFYIYNGANISMRLPFKIGMDTLSCVMLILQFIVGIIAYFSVTPQQKNSKSFWIWFVVLNILCSASFLSMSYFWFFIFFEILIIPTYFLISGWGGKNKKKAGIKYFLYSFSGSIFLFLALVLIMSESGTSLLGFGEHLTQYSTAIFFLLLIGFGIKIPIVGFHSWLPEAHYEASTPISIILAGVLLKLGAYGLIRFGFFEIPSAVFAYQNWIIFWGAASILYGAVCVLAQKDLKKLIAYSSISHMGFVIVGMATLNQIGYYGAVFQMFSHGLLAAGMFYIAGLVYKQVESYRISDISFSPQLNPMLSYTVAICLFASTGLPGFSAFISEILVFWGLVSTPEMSMGMLSIFLLIIGLGLIFTVLYTARLYYRLTATKETVTPINAPLREYFILIIILILSFFIGIYPKSILTSIHY